MGMPVDPNQNIVVTCGSTEAMMAAMMTVTNPATRSSSSRRSTRTTAPTRSFRVPSPSTYRSTRPHSTLTARRSRQPSATMIPRPSSCATLPTPAARSLRARSSPLSPTSAKVRRYCITDEVYEHIVYAPHEHVYMATLPGMFERTISCSSLSKTYSITGWRLGYTIAPAQITERIKKVHDFLTVGAAAPLQEPSLPPSTSTTAITMRSSTSIPPNAICSARGSIASVLNTTCRRAPTTS